MVNETSSTTEKNKQIKTPLALFFRTFLNLPRSGSLRIYTNLDMMIGSKIRYISQNATLKIQNRNNFTLPDVKSDKIFPF